MTVTAAPVEQHVRIVFIRDPTKSEAAYTDFAVSLAGRFTDMPGAYDGYAFGSASEFSMYLYGPSADALWARARPAVDSSPLARGGYVIRRPGGPDVADARHALP